MPTIDNERGVLVVRVVYDGPALCGKTTTLRALAAGLGVGVTTPEEVGGRTLFFDWVDYVGGLFEGRQIRCQLVSVPGQPELTSRRRALLSSADAIVLVVDGRASEMPRARRWLADLRPRCRAAEPPVGLVLQVNKRDAPDSVPRTELPSRLGLVDPAAIVESVATSGDGVREAFVLAVRLALDRVRWLAERGQLPAGRPEIDGPDDLLAQLAAQAPIAAPLSAPAAADDAREASLVRHAPHRAAAVLQPSPLPERLFTPDPMMPGGFIWPPVDGRALLHEVAQLGVVPSRTRQGDWWAHCGGWLCHSAGGAWFDDRDLGRHALIAWARLHVAHQRRLSDGRALILADAGDSAVRLWQLVRVGETLHDVVEAQCAQGSAEALAGALEAVARHLLRARAAFHAPGLSLPCTLSTVQGDLRSAPAFVGLVPGHDEDLAPEPEGEALLARELGPVIARLRAARRDYRGLVSSLGGETRQPGDGVGATLARLGSQV